MTPRWKRWTFVGMTLLILLLVTEIIAQAGYYVAFGNRWHPDRLARFNSLGAYGIAQIRALRMERPQTFVHPYLGRYTVTARTDPRFLGNYAIADTPPLEYEPNSLSIVLFGGSVALQMGVEGKLAPAIERELTRLGFPGRKVHLLVAAQSGGKQPIQLMALLHLLVQGIRIDAAISLDGYNEINFGPGFNRQWRLNTTYPYRWFLLQRMRWGGFNPPIAGRWDALVRQEHELAFPRSRPAHHYSALVGLFLTYRARALKQAILGLQNKVLATALPWKPEELGPRVKLSPAEDVRASAALWARSTRLMAGLARRHGFVFIDFLQPIQYDKGSKPLSAEERKIAFAPGGKFDRGWNVAMGYPLLRKSGSAMLRDGISFVDASQIFRNERRTVYSDRCCHFNPRGIDAIVDFMARHTARALAARLKKRR